VTASTRLVSTKADARTFVQSEEFPWKVPGDRARTQAYSSWCQLQGERKYPPASSPSIKLPPRMSTFTRITFRLILAGCCPMSTTGGGLPTNNLSLHRSFPFTLYNVNPGERSNVVGPSAEHCYERDDGREPQGGLVYPNRYLRVHVRRSDSNNPCAGRYFPLHALAPGTGKVDHRLVLNRCARRGLKPVIPYIFRIPKGKKLPHISHQ
jgi:hypothetical protein